MAANTRSPADVEDDEMLQRYLATRRLFEMVRDAARRADAQRRLEYALRTAICR